MASLFDELENYSHLDYYPFHMPGHKRNIAGSVLKDVMAIDITEIDGFDDLHDAKGILDKAQKRAARVCHAKESFFLVNGSTSGILSAISATVPMNGHLLLARNSHKAAYNTVLLRNLITTYLYPNVDTKFQICQGITRQQVHQTMQEIRDEGKILPQAVFITSPTYEGVVSEIEEIAKVVHDFGSILIVDEAHGAHFGIEGFPNNSCQAGADIVIQSVHKTLPSMTQTALLHVNGNRVDVAKLRKYLSIYQSSSPSYVLMASIDSAMELVEEQGDKLASDFLKKKDSMLMDLKQLKHLRVLNYESETSILDPCKLVISTKNTNCTGRQLYDILREKYHLQMEMSSGTYIIAMMSIMDTKEGIDRLTKALLEIDNQLETVGITNETFCMNMKKVGMPIAEAFELERESMILEQCDRRTSAEFIYVYPPGIPIIAPGEVFTGKEVDTIKTAINMGLNVKGLTDNKIWVTKEH